MASKKKSEKTVKVFLRVRPPGKEELKRNDQFGTVSIQPDNPEHCQLHPPNPKDENDVKDFSFHGCFGENSTQKEVYEAVARGAVDDVFEGYHGLVFVYGQTGTGKTHTLCCKEPGQEGILYNSVNEIFSRIQQDTNMVYECSLTFVQIYNELIYDLLTPERTPLELRDNPEEDYQGAVYMPGSMTVPVASCAECLSYFDEGDRRRTTGETLMNMHSSRSHTVFLLDVQSRQRISKEEVDTATVDGSVKQGRLILVDLAGSEKIKKTGSHGARLQEAKNINGSLLVLGRVVNALIDPSAGHVPFRESKLTRLLQYPLSGMGKTSLIITCGPSMYNYDETLATIGFGQRALLVKEQAKVHQKQDWKALALRLQAIVESGTDKIKEEALEEQKQEWMEQEQKYLNRIRELETMVERLQAGESVPTLERTTSTTRQDAPPDADHPEDGDGQGETTWATGPLLDADGAQLLSENIALRQVIRGLQDEYKKIRERIAKSKREKKTVESRVKRLELEKSALEAKLTEARKERDPALSPRSSPRGPRQKAPTSGAAEEDGTLECWSPTGAATPGTTAEEDEAYANTSEMLASALQVLSEFKRTNKELENEARISRNSSAKVTARLYEMDEEMERLRVENATLKDKLRRARKNGKEAHPQTPVETAPPAPSPVA